MHNLLEATERICELKGNVVALNALAGALMTVLPHGVQQRLLPALDSSAEAARTAMLNAAISELSIAAFEQDVARLRGLLQALQRGTLDAVRSGIEPLLLAVPRVTTLSGQTVLTGASGFFFARDERLFLVTSRHVLIDDASAHAPDNLQVQMHAANLPGAAPIVLSLPLYKGGRAAWRQARDAGGDIDVAVLEIDRALLGDARPAAFTPAHLQAELSEVDVGTPLLIVGFPLGFHDDVNLLPVARQAAIASSFGTRFQGHGLFLTDARMHRGSSGAPVVMRDASTRAGDLPWKLMGIHSARFDMGGRDQAQDEQLGLNAAWYADVLNTLTRA